MVNPLHQLVKKDQKWSWEEEQEEAFEGLRYTFTIEPVLIKPNLDKEWKVEADTLSENTGYR